MAAAFYRAGIMSVRSILKKSVLAILFVPFTVLIGLAAAISRLLPKKFDVGIGPEPLINNINHRLAMIESGWSTETYVTHTYFITNDFDYSTAQSRFPLVLCSYWAFLRALFRYRILYFYFNGGPLAWTPHRFLEGPLYRLAGIKTVVMPYGGDVHDLLHGNNLLFKHAMAMDYPQFQKSSRDKVSRQVKYWSRWADHIVSGCDWVDFMWHWDTLVSAHFSVDTRSIKVHAPEPRQTIKILHAPNHRNIKGTPFVIQAADRLISEGYPVELVLAERRSNNEILALIHDADIVVDQLVIGWYGMFGVEAMAHGRPVICYLREDLCSLFKFAGVMDPEDPPVLNTNYGSIYEQLKLLVESKDIRLTLGARGRQYIEKWHSTEALGKIFDRINAKLSNSREN